MRPSFRPGFEVSSPCFLRFKPIRVALSLNVTIACVNVKSQENIT